MAQIPTDSQLKLINAVTVDVPTLQYKKVHRCGTLEFVLHPKGNQPVDSEEELSLPRRRRAQRLRTKMLGTFIVSDRKISKDLTLADGAFVRNTDRWLWHKELDDVGTAFESDHEKILRQITASWANGISRKREKVNTDGQVIVPGLRNSQEGALDAIGSHWSLSSEPATVVMPTGTGKTEAMLCTLVEHACERVLVLVPSLALRRQTKAKFLLLGKLRELGIVSDTVRNPIVGTLLRRPRTARDIAFLGQCNVIISTPAVLAQDAALRFLPKIAGLCSHLFVDEAHHIKANTWSKIKEAFLNSGKKVLQFTATPFREDGRRLDGKFIYVYPLRRAQQEGCFKSIRFEGLFELPGPDADRKVAERAVAILRSDLAAGLDHLLMARCMRQSRAREILTLYQELAPDLNPILVISDEPDSEKDLQALFTRDSRVIVSVNMLGEGFDLPQLKVAAVHDKHKSLGVLLQFAGRFTRSAPANVGDATVVANTGDTDVKDALESLYEEDADWNHLLAHYSFRRVEQERELLQFLRNARSLREPPEGEQAFSLNAISPKFASFIYETDRFEPHSFHRAIPATCVVHACWEITDPKMLVLVSAWKEDVDWYRTRAVSNKVWHLTLFYYSEKHRLLFITTSRTEYIPNDLAEAVTGGAAQIVSGETIFRSLGKIQRLILTQVGLKRHGDRKHRHTQYSGSDVEEAIHALTREGSSKSNLFGFGYRDGRKIGVGCSAKGKVWGRYGRGRRHLRYFVDWCEEQGRYLRDANISTDDILKRVLIPTRLYQEFPAGEILAVIWPDELLNRAETSASIIFGQTDFPLYDLEIEVDRTRTRRSEIVFTISSDNLRASFKMSLIPDNNGYKVEQMDGPNGEIEVGRRKTNLAMYFNDYPPDLLMLDGSEIHGCNHYPVARKGIGFARERMRAISWDGIDVRKESLFRSGTIHTNTVQHRAFELCRDNRFEIIFDDDSPGEIADLICLREQDDRIFLRLIHCKYASTESPAGRIKDVIEVCAQAAKCIKYVGNFEALYRRMEKRETASYRKWQRSRYLVGNRGNLRRLRHIGKYAAVESEIIVVQPGIRVSDPTEDQLRILSSADAYLHETVRIPLHVWGGS